MKKILVGIISIAILVAALVFALVDALVPLKIWTHPILNFLFIAAVGFGCLALVLGFAGKKSFWLFIGNIIFALGICYVLAQFLEWWLCIIIPIAVIVIMAIISFLVVGNRTEDALNKDKNYKTYEQRKAEENAAKAQEEKPELPKIKSFKD